MIADVLARLFLGVALQPEPQFFVELHKFLARIAVVHAVVVAVDQIHEGLQVWRAPPAVEIGIAEPQIPLADKTGENIIIVNIDPRRRTGFCTFGTKHPSIG